MKAVENIKTHILCPKKIFPPENRTVYEIMFVSLYSTGILTLKVAYSSR